MLSFCTAVVSSLYSQMQLLQPRIYAVVVTAAVPSYKEQCMHAHGITIMNNVRLIQIYQKKLLATWFSTRAHTHWQLVGFPETYVV